MNQWQESFVKKVGAVRDESARKFERVADQVVDRVCGEFTEFAAGCEFQSSTPQSQKGLRTVKFTLTENAYVLVSFRFQGFDAVDCDYECFIPHQGRVEGLRSTVALHSVGREWVERCFQTALDDFVTRFSDGLRVSPVAEPVAV